MSKKFDIYKLKYKKNNGSYFSFNDLKFIIKDIFEDFSKLDYLHSQNLNYAIQPMSKKTGYYITIVPQNKQFENFKVLEYKRLNGEVNFKSSNNINENINNKLIFFQMGVLDEDNLKIFKNGNIENISDFNEDEKNTPIFISTCALIIDEEHKKIFFVKEYKKNHSINFFDIYNYIISKSEHGKNIKENNFSVKSERVKNDINQSINDVGEIRKMEISVNPEFVRKISRDNESQDSMKIVALKEFFRGIPFLKRYNYSMTFENQTKSNIDKNLVFLKEYFECFFDDSKNTIYLEDINSNNKKKEKLNNSLNRFKIEFIPNTGEEKLTYRILDKEMAVICELNDNYSRRQESPEKELEKIKSAFEYFEYNNIFEK